MKKRFKSALNRMEAEEALVSRTEAYLQQALATGYTRRSSSRATSRQASLRSLATAACIALFIFAGSAGAYNYYQTPAAYVSVDINPSVELGVNGLNRVVFVKPYNEDGQEIISGLDLKGMTVDEAVNLILAAASEHGYIADDGSTLISITTETDEADLAAQLEDEAENGAAEGLAAEGKTAVIVTDNVSLTMREEAENAGITPGKLNLINKLQAVNPDATVDEYRDASVKEIIRDTQAAQGKDKKDAADLDAEDNMNGNNNNNEEDDIDREDEDIMALHPQGSQNGDKKDDAGVNQDNDNSDDTEEDQPGQADQLSNQGNQDKPDKPEKQDSDSGTSSSNEHGNDNGSHNNRSGNTSNGKL